MNTIMARIAAAAGTRLAIAALLLHVLAHGIGKTLVFPAAGQVQAAHGSTSIRDITGVLSRSRLVGGAFIVGLAVLLGMPPFAMFASELSISRALADAPPPPIPVQYCYRTLAHADCFTHADPDRITRYTGLYPDPLSIPVPAPVR